MTDQAPKFLVRRHSDGQYFRGAHFWQWTRNWKWAAQLDMKAWHMYLDHGYVYTDYRLFDFVPLSKVKE